MMPYFVNQDQLEIFYQVINPYHNDFPVILIHGYGKSQAMFKHQIKLLQKYFKVILFDAIGHGNSDTAHVEFQENLLDSTIHDLEILLETLKIRYSFGILGHSLFGCAVAQQIAILHPEKVDFLILLNGGSLVLDSTIRNIFWNLLPHFTRMHFNQFPPDTVQKLIEKTMPYIIKTVSPEEIKLTHAELKLLRAKVEDDIYSLIEEPLTPIGIMCPTLIIGAELDNFSPVFMSKELHAKIQQSLLRVISMAGHFGLAQRYQEYNQHILSFLSQMEFIITKNQ